MRPSPLAATTTAAQGPEFRNRCRNMAAEVERAVDLLTDHMQGLSDADLREWRWGLSSYKGSLRVNSGEWAMTVVDPMPVVTDAAS
jgi:hypothetical protein